MNKMEFFISKQEIQRRIIAFTTLVTGLVAGSAIALYDFWIQDFWLAFTYILILLFVFLVFRILILRFFKSLQETKVYLSDEYLERKSRQNVDKISIARIEKIMIRKTTKGNIRDIIILFGGRTLAFDGLENFAQFEESLINKCDKKVVVKESKEHIDYDHPLFYLVLGMLVSFAMVFAMRYIIDLDGDRLKIIYLIIALYATAMGVFFIFNQPIKKRYGGKKPTTDLALGLILLCAGISVYFLG